MQLHLTTNLQPFIPDFAVHDVNNNFFIVSRFKNWSATNLFAESISLVWTQGLGTSSWEDTAHHNIGVPESCVEMSHMHFDIHHKNEKLFSYDGDQHILCPKTTEVY